MPAQHAAPATQQDAAKAVAENAEAPMAATDLRYMDFMELLQLIDIDGYSDRPSSHQSGGFHGGAIGDSLHETSRLLAASGFVALSTWLWAVTNADAMEQPMQPCPDCESTQHGSEPAQHAVKGAATAPTVIQANRAMATRREKASGIQRMRQVYRISLRCAAMVVVAPPNVRANRATTAGRQARAGENVPRTTGPGLVACRWRSG